ncbi:hypothetical protein [Phenylobacterium sp.]|uniref:hypothetical protein n=1 Tax=Phenylobacterium sp. TaxID=1871053 RepID=UPI0030F4377C
MASADPQLTTMASSMIAALIDAAPSVTQTKGETMKPSIAYRACQIAAAALVVNYVATVRNIALGDFDHVGLALPMVRMEAVGNGLSAIGWAVVLGVSFTSQAAAWSKLAYPLAGMLLFDVLTTWPLDMPLPPGFLWWGSAGVAAQVLIGLTLERGARAAAQT